MMFDDEPFFRRRYVLDSTVENKHGYWEEYNRNSRTWSRICDRCLRKVCRTSSYLCTVHYNQMKRKKTKNVLFEIEEEVNGPTGIVLSISSSLTKKQLAQVREFITKFHRDSQPVQFTCETQPDYIDESTTHVITNDCGSFTTRMTKQIIQACVRHIFIGSIGWITSSLDQGSILDHFPYEILRDDKSPKNTRGLKQCRFDQLPVFPSSCIVAIECHAGVKSLHMTREELSEIVDLSGATLLDDYMNYQTLIILCQTKKEMLEKKKKFDEMKTTNVFFCKPNYLFESIIRHELQAIENYLL